MTDLSAWYIWEQTNLQDPEPSHERQRLLFLTGLLMFKIPAIAVYYLVNLAKEIEVANNGPLVTLLTNAVIAAVKAMGTGATVINALANESLDSTMLKDLSTQLQAATDTLNAAISALPVPTTDTPPTPPPATGT